MIRFEHVRKEFPDATPLKDINGGIDDGKIVTIIGPSGTGKTTLLRLINGLGKPTSGKIFYNDTEITAKGTDISEIRKEIGMVFQSYNLFNHLSILDNIVVPQMDILKRSRAEAEEKAIKLLELLGLDHAKDKMPSELSGGQKQRVAIARTVAMDPKVILFDEPTSALDPHMTREIGAILKHLKDGMRTLIIVTHDMKLSENVSDEVIFLNDGVICERGTPEQIFHNPQNVETKIFIKQMKTLKISTKTKDFDIADAIKQVRDFCMNQNIEFELWNDSQSVVEELIGNTICKDSVNRDLNFMMAYNEEEERIGYEIEYSGSEFNPLSNDTLETKIVSLAIENIQYEYDEDDRYCNKMNFLSKRRTVPVSPKEKLYGKC